MSDELTISLRYEMVFLMDKFCRKEKMVAADWKLAIAFVLPRYSANEPVPKCQTIGKIK